jgi:hypothetical protein
MDAHREQIAEFIGFTPAPEPAPTLLHREAGDGSQQSEIAVTKNEEDSPAVRVRCAELGRW